MRTGRGAPPAGPTAGLYGGGFDPSPGSSLQLFGLRPGNCGLDAAGGTLTLPTQPPLTFRPRHAGAHGASKEARMNNVLRNYS